MDKANKTKLIRGCRTKQTARKSTSAPVVVRNKSEYEKILDAILAVNNDINSTIQCELLTISEEIEVCKNLLTQLLKQQESGEASK